MKMNSNFKHGYIALLPHELSDPDYPRYGDGPIWGTGMTEKAALAEAQNWLPREEEPAEGLAALPATVELIALVEEVGGDVAFWKNEDGLYDVCSD